MKAVITVTGKDCVGIIADVSAVCSKSNANIVEITQSVISEYFAMIMLVDITNLNIPFADFSDMMAELGKTDAGGGGTVAKYVAKMNINTIDIGVAVIAMHAPYEVVSKADVYHAYLACRAFIK